MKTLISLQNISYAYDSSLLFENLSLSVNCGDRVALVGHNGCGKSTLLKLLSSSLELSTGTLVKNRGMKLEVVEQYLPKNLESFTLKEALLDKLTSEQRDYESYLVDQLLFDFFFKEHEFDIVVKDLSGGQKNRLMMARAIILNPDLVLMDEPTNHLDLKTLLYIEEYLMTKASFSFLIISHDKRFLDRVTNTTVIVRDGRTYSFKLNYSKSLNRLSKMDEDAKKARELEEKEISRLKVSAKRLAQWGKVYDNEDLAKKAKTMEKRIDKLEDQKSFLTKGNPYELDLKTGQSLSKLALQFHNYPVFYGERLLSTKDNLLFKIEQIYIKTGEKIAILGDNGVGKTTFLKSLIERVKVNSPCEQFKLSPTMELGVYDQEQDVLSSNHTIFDEVQELSGLNNHDVKQSLISVGFNYDEHGKEIKTLSGGEKSRIIFLILSLNCPNTLILDEPTNHLDLEGKNELRESLIESDATIILTGHDREFIESVATRFLMIRNGELIEIDSPLEFYNSLREEKPLLFDKSNTSSINSNEESCEESIMEKILELEAKLEADLLRKVKFQKAHLQVKWREKIKELYMILEK